MSRHHVLLLSLATLALGCSANVQFDDGAGGGDNCLAYPSCGPEAVAVESCPDTSCFTIETCDTEILCHPQQNCYEGPSCDYGSFEVADCQGQPNCGAVTACGITIFCQQETCQGLPSCDVGDQQVTTCPDDAFCYEVVACGTSVLCMDQGQPHGCPEFEPTRSQACQGLEGQWCDYPTANNCFSSYLCESESGSPGPVWRFAGGGCN